MKRGVKKHQATIGAIRIISGQWRGRKLPVLDAQGLRPTTDRNKETLFNWLMPYTSNSYCLDVFAGSGGLGFEALSRYATSVTFIELDKQAAKNLQQNANLLKVSAQQARIITGDAAQVLIQLTQAFDIIFLDPPFHQNLLATTVEQIEQAQLLKKGGVIYIECEGQGENYAVPDTWQLIKQNQSKQITSRLYQRSNDSN
ncbi:MAG: 16S rRNA (guanine966-N2)-methyltransferase [Paraglaciecola sp.]|jgi:16S rRNA (guanine966-N2)-methyltransferase